MTTIIQFRNRPITDTPRRVRPPLALGFCGIVALAGLALAQLSSAGGPLPKLPQIIEERPTGDSVTRYFALCDRVRRDDCVIDGDTFAFRGERIRIADIDAPETHPPRCAQEARLGEAATRRLQGLLSAGPFSLRAEGRDADRYGRKLRTVIREGQSIGAVLVSEGLARTWTGRRLPWC